MLALFAQAARNKKWDDDDFPREFIVIILAVVCGMFLFHLLIKIPYILTLSKTLRHCRPRTRKMQPGLLWLYLIPYFDLIWHFFIVLKIAESLRREFRSRGLSIRNEDFGHGLGLTMCITFVCAFIPYIGSCIALVGLVCWIMYWVKMAGYNNRLARDGEYDDGDEEDRWDDEEYEEKDKDDSRDDEDDDRPRKSRTEYEADDDDRPRKRRTEYDDEDDDGRPRRR
jgi:hypothetical protein